MIIEFFKYQGTGNDFIILDNRNGNYTALTPVEITFLCNRRFGIGADGLMMLQLKQGYDFEMVYYNADGKEGSMCGNGGRCLVAFAKRLKLITDKAFFIATDGEHEAKITADDNVELKMKDVESMEIGQDYTVLDTGSPHYIQWEKHDSKTDVFTEGKRIRNSTRFAEKGINVNFVEVNAKHLTISTYERGVEAETLSCGTGVTAAALAASGDELKHYETKVVAKGGSLTVKFNKTGTTNFNDIWLCGSAQFVFSGTIDVPG
jgi:diaminopimelate epimerase